MTSTTLLGLDGDGWLHTRSGGPRVVILPSTRACALGPRGPLGLVWHATGGVGGPCFAENLAKRITTFTKGRDRAASWHVLIAKDGVLYQSVPLSKGAWHIGTTGTIDGHDVSLNHATIGVELESAGQLAKIGEDFFAWPFWKDRDRREPDPKLVVSREHVSASGGHWFESFSDRQIASSRHLIASLAQEWGWTAERFRHAHADFAAPRKTDPGDLWMRVILPGLLSDVFAPAPPATESAPLTIFRRPDSMPAATLATPVASPGGVAPLQRETPAIVPKPPIET